MNVIIGFQTRIGYRPTSTLCQSSPVFFYVQRSSNFGTKNVPIPFELEAEHQWGNEFSIWNLQHGPAAIRDIFFLLLRNFGCERHNDFKISLMIRNGGAIAGSECIHSLRVRVSRLLKL